MFCIDIAIFLLPFWVLVLSLSKDNSQLLYIDNTHSETALLTAIGIARYYSNPANHQSLVSLH